jgi:hypothetical protein
MGGGGFDASVFTTNTSHHNNDASRRITSTIRRLPTVPTISTHEPTAPSTLLCLSVSVKSDLQNVDAERGGDRIVLTTVSSEDTLPPSTDGTSGFDGVVVLDLGPRGTQGGIIHPAASQPDKKTSRRRHNGLMAISVGRVG